jgi:membrane protein
VVNLLVQTALSNLVPGIISFLLFLILYRQVPRVPIGWREAAVSAVAAAVAWRLASIGFVWYLRSGLVSYNLVYGSLGSLAALLFWIYWSGWILLFGAHLCSAIAISERVDRMAACAVVDQEEDTEESS